MRFVWAVAAFFLAAVLIGAGIAQRTVFLGPKSEQTPISVEEGLPFTLIDGAVLNRLPGAQNLVVRGDGTIFAAYGRTADMKAWLADSSYNAVTLAGDGSVDTLAVVPTVTAPEDGGDDATEQPPAEDPATEAPGAEAEVAASSPIGSDLWLDEFQQEDALYAPLQLPDTMSVLVASDGTAAAPADITVSWPLDNSTPWAGPLIVTGGILMILGVLFYLLGIRNVRRSRGPRRKGLPPVPETVPIDLAVKAADKGVISSGPPTTRRAITSGRRGFVVLPVVAISALLFTGCSAEAWPQMSPSPTPSPSESVIDAENQQAPAVTETQAERILTRVADTVAEADEAKDAALAATRLDGPALAERTTNYALRGKITDYKALPAIPAKPLAVLLPQAFDGWPRTVMSIVKDRSDETVPPMIAMMTQQDPWSEYKVVYLANMEASAELPGVAPATIGATQVQPDSPFLLMPPNQVAAAYADILTNGEKSQYYELFDAEQDHFRTSVAEDRKTRLEDFNKTGAKTGTFTFAASAAPEDPLSLLTLESGAIVAVNVHETDTVKPKNKDAVIKLPDNPTVKALAGAEQSSTGFSTTFSDQLFFYVPGQGSDEKIRLLGYGSNILGAKVIK